MRPLELAGQVLEIAPEDRIEGIGRYLAGIFVSDSLEGNPCTIGVGDTQAEAIADAMGEYVREHPGRDVAVQWWLP